jgi:hypothetical protein
MAAHQNYSMVNIIAPGFKKIIAGQNKSKVVQTILLLNINTGV